MPTTASNPAIGASPLQEQNNPFVAEAPMDSLAPKQAFNGGEEDDEPGTPQDERERRWAERMRGLQRAAQWGGRLAGLAGFGGAAGALGDVGAVAGAAGAVDGVGPGAIRSLGANQGGLAARRIAEKRGLSKGKSAAVGGAVAGALAGEGVKGMAQTAGSWYALYIAFGLLPTLLGSVPALLYLNFHYIMAARGSEYFRPMFFWQKMTLLFADILAVIILFILTVLIISIYQMIENPSGALQFLS